MHLPLRSVVIDRVTGGAVRGYLNAEEERENTSKSGGNKNKRQSNGRKRRKERRGALVSDRRGTCRGGKVERG